MTTVMEPAQSSRPGCCSSCFSCLCCCKEVCALVCCPPCPGAITAKMAFQPPQPATYEFKVEDHRINIYISNPFEIHDRTRRKFEPLSPVHVLRDVRTRRGNTLAAFFIEVESSPLTILFSHGNAVDLGVMAVFLASLSAQTNCSVFAYDYSGYGLSSGNPREKNVYADIEAAYSCLTQRFAVHPRRIVAYGQSIGTTATVDFASKHSEIAGVVLHSPLASGLRVLRPSLQRTYCCDPFPNIKKVSSIEQPTLIIHGKEDEVIALSHGVMLHEACPGSEQPVWVAGAGHNDVEMYAAYGDKLSDFLDTLTLRVQTSTSGDQAGAISQAEAHNSSSVIEVQPQANATIV
eukprot:m.34394 g.34394  ORF g.34394 m.34394 type:complete len:348 (+) comp12299_c0_seq1:57-1100(+)